MRCSSCGAEVEPQANFCIRCGADLRVEETEVTGERTEAPLDRSAASASASAEQAAGEQAAGTDQRPPGPDRAVDTIVSEAPVEAAAPADDDPTDPDLPPVQPGGPGGAQEVAVDSTAPPSAPLRTCAACGSPNSARRMLCGRCGRSLDRSEEDGAREGDAETEPPPRRRAARASPAAAAAAAAGASSTASPRRRGRRGISMAVVVVLGLLAGAGIGAMAGLHRGPFAVSSGPPPAPGFDPGAYPAASQTVGIASVRTATTHAPLAERTFGAALMLDDDLASAWNNDGATHPQGAGETITLMLDRPAWVDGIRLANGAQADDAGFHGNARVRRARLRFDGGEEVTVRFLDQQGWQQLSLDHPRLTTVVQIEVVDAYPGDTYDDLAVSELRLVGWDAMGEDARVAQERAAVAPADAPRTPSPAGGS